MLNPWPTFSNEEIEAVSNVLKQGTVNYWTGDHVQSFEFAFSNFFESKYSIAHANGTLALENAYRSLRLPDLSEVITTSR